MDWGIVAIILVAVGGAIGAVLRYAVGHFVDSSTFPYATLIVNVVGCTLLAFLMFSVGPAMDGRVRLLLFTGVFGAFTTFSTFSIETVNLFYDGFLAKALANVLANSGACLAGAFIGRYLALLI